MPAGAWRQTTATWSSLTSPASNAALVSGSSPNRRAIRTSDRARPGDTPHFQPTHCSADRMPQPFQDPVRSTSAITPTSRPVAALMTPHSSAISASSRPASASASRFSITATGPS